VPVRKKIGEILVETGAVTEDQVRQALGQQRSWGAGRRLGEMLISTNGVSPTAVARALAQQFDLPFIELPEIPRGVSELVPVELQVKHRVVPFRVETEGKSERILLAVADPAKLDLLDELRFNLHKPLRVYVAATDDIDSALAELRGQPEEQLEELAIELEVGDLEVERNASNMVAGGWFAPAAPAAAAPIPAAPASAPAPPAAPRVKSAAEALDDLLGGLDAKPAPPPPAIPVMKFGASKAEKKPDRLEFTDQDLKVLDALERVADGADAKEEGEKVRPERLVASLIRLLIRKGVIHELELLEELARK